MNRRGFLKYLGLTSAAAAAPALEAVATPAHYHEKRTFDFDAGTLTVSKEECRELKCERPILTVDDTNKDFWTSDLARCCCRGPCHCKDDSE